MTASRISSHRSAKPRLTALLDGTVVGHVHQDASGRLRFKYDDEWRNSPSSYPISLSMPLTGRDHRHSAIRAFLWGLLPDSARTLGAYARMFGVSAGNPMSLLAHLGADCPGAIQFAPPEQAEALMGTSPGPITVNWMTIDDVAAELRTVREEGISGGSSRTTGQFSLAGAQPKIALFEHDGRWGRPRERIPSNRILKPPSSEYRAFAENEHFSLDLAMELGLPAARSRVMRF